MNNEIIYQVFVRNHSNEGTLEKVTSDLKRIKELGATIIYLMPIHEIGIKNRKGTFGSPYAIKDYFSISSDLGTLSDFHNLVTSTHKLGMKIILDMVFNHTAPDNILLPEHEDYYFHKEDGALGNRVGEWSDIIDLNTHKKETQDYLISVLKYWVNQGVDGFRFDVASLIPLEFFIRARKELGDEIIFFSESIDDDFVNYAKQLGLSVIQDTILYPTFQCLYNYSWYRPMEHHFKYQKPFEDIIKNINRDNKDLNPNLLRANCLENHDCDRFASLVKNKNQLIEWIRFSCALKGHVFIYAGEEYGVEKKPELFEKDPIDWSQKNLEIYNLYKDLIKKKKEQKQIVSQLVEYENGFTILNQTLIDGTKITSKFKLN